MRQTLRWSANDTMRVVWVLLVLQKEVIRTAVVVFGNDWSGSSVWEEKKGAQKWSR